MEHDRALERIAEIHAHMSRGEVYRGWRPVPVAVSGLIGLAAAAARPGLGDPIGFVTYWLAVAVTAMIIGCSEIALQYVRAPEGYERRHTRQVLEQFLPALAAGVFVTVTFVRLSRALVPLLPGLWALFFGIGILAARPYLPRVAGLTALYFWTAGLAAIWFGPEIERSLGWVVGLIFGGGQLLGALLLWRDGRVNGVSHG